MILESDAATLQEIVELEGNCLSKDRCMRCPFRAMCLPEFLNPAPPTKNQRFTMALDILTHNALMDHDTDMKKIRIGRKNSKHID